METRPLKDKVILVTGGAQGMGRAMTLGLAAQGASVVVCDIATEAAAATVREAANLGGAGHAIAIDIRKQEGCERAVEETLAAFGKVHGLINNAGCGMTAIRQDYLDRPVRFWEVEIERWQALMDINVLGAFLMARAVAPHLVRQKWGRIVNVTTSLDTMYRASYTPYGPSKAWLEAATVSWARDLKEHGVTCNALIPGGAVNTAFFAKDVPMDREALIQPSVMAGPACWLMSEASNGVTSNRYVARDWDLSLEPAAAAQKIGKPAAWQSMGPQSMWPSAAPVN